MKPSEKQYLAELEGIIKDLGPFIYALESQIPPEILKEIHKWHAPWAAVPKEYQHIAEVLRSARSLQYLVNAPAKEG